MGMIDSLVLSSQAVSRPEFYNMLHKHLLEVQPPVDIINREIKQTLIQRGEEYRIRELSLELKSIASSKIKERETAMGMAGLVGIATGGIIGLNYLAIDNFNNLTANLGFLGKLSAVYFGIIPVELGISLISCLPARILSRVFSKVGGEIEKYRIVRSLNKDLSKAINA